MNTPPEPTPAPATDDQADGIRCPQCAIRLVVTLTRDSAPGLKVRFVRCPKCNLTARTEERLVRTFPGE